MAENTGDTQNVIGYRRHTDERLEDTGEYQRYAGGCDKIINAECTLI
jgi:hypothetical protein